MRIHLCLLMTVLCVIGCAGCASRTHPAKMHQEDQPYLNEGRIQFETSSMKWVIEIADVKIKYAKGEELFDTQVPGSRMRIFVTVRNKTKDHLWVDTRTSFIDNTGVVAEQTNWAPFHCDPRTVSTYVCTALNPRVSDYQVIFRKPAKTE